MLAGSKADINLLGQMEECYKSKGRMAFAMLVSLCGTPGTGKTTVSGLLTGRGFHIISSKDLIERFGLGQPAEDGSGEIEVDLELFREELASWSKGIQGRTVLEGHLSYLAPCDLCLLLRTDPDIIIERGLKRGYSPKKARENAESEGIGYLLHECMEEERAALNGKDWKELPAAGRIVLEVDATPLLPDGVADWIVMMVDGFEGKKLNELSPYRPGHIDWIEVLAGWF